VKRQKKASMTIQSKFKNTCVLFAFTGLLPVGSPVALAETMPTSSRTECEQQLYVSQYSGLPGEKLADSTRHLYVTSSNAGQLPTSLDTNTLVNFTGCGDDATALAINLRRTWDYYKNIFNRTGFDNKNTNLMAYVNTSVSTAQSDGGTRLSFSSKCSRCMKVMEMVAHEFTHSVLGQTTSFYGSASEQSQALNESLASIFGLAVHNYWSVDNSYIYGATVENMSNPPSTGGIDHMDFYDASSSANAHINGNGGVIAKAAFLLAEGGLHARSQVSVNGVGRGKMERILYYTMTNNDKANTRLTSKATFLQFAEAAYLAAKELYPTERKTHASVYWAFKAVGINISNSDAYVQSGVSVAR